MKGVLLFTDIFEASKTPETWILSLSYKKMDIGVQSTCVCKDTPAQEYKLCSWFQSSSFINPRLYGLPKPVTGFLTPMQARTGAHTWVGTGAEEQAREMSEYAQPGNSLV